MLAAAFAKLVQNPTGRKLLKNTLKLLWTISSFTAMSQTEFRGWFRFNLNESQLELAWDRMQWRNEEKSPILAIGIAKISIPCNSEIRNKSCRKKRKNCRINRERAYIGIASISIHPESISPQMIWIRALLWNSSQSVNPSALCIESPKWKKSMR